MDRKIGNYIHYRARNYMAYGEGRNMNDRTPLYNFAQKREQMLSEIKMKSSANEQDLKDIQKSVSQILSRKSVFDSKEVRAVRDAVEEKIKDKFKTQVGNINMQTGNVNMSAKDLARRASNKKMRTDNRGSVRMNTILDRLTKLDDLIPLIGDAKTKDRLQNSINQINSAVKEIAGMTVAELREFGVPPGKKLLQIGGGTSTSDNDSLVSKINETMSNFAAVPSLAQQKGDLFEYVIALAPYVGENKAKKDIEEYMKTKIGDEKSSVEINFDEFFTEDMSQYKKTFERKGYKFQGNSLMTIMPTQEKIDVLLEWNDEIIPISAKNINLKTKQDITVVSGTSLLYLLQDESSDFANHYLNVMATHKDDSAIPQSIRTEATQTMQALIMLKAIRGGTYGRGAADVFILNDNSSKKSDSIKVYDVPTLINRVCQDMENNSAIQTRLDNSSVDFSKKRFINSWSNISPEARIASLLSEVHRTKIHASINSNFFS